MGKDLGMFHTFGWENLLGFLGDGSFKFTQSFLRLVPKGEKVNFVTYLVI